MKKKLLMFSIPIGLWLLIGCTKDDFAQGNTITFQAICGGSDTRTAMDDYGTVTWSSGEVINVNGTKSTGSPTISADGKTAEFAVPASVSKDGGYYYAYYPGDKVSCYTTGSHQFTVTLPTTQDYENETTFATNTNPSVAVGDDTQKLSFYNLCGILKIQVMLDGGTGGASHPNVYFNSLVFSAAENMAGAAIVTVDRNDIKKSTIAATGSKAVTVEKKTSGKWTLNGTPITFYIVLPPGSYTNWQITLKDGSTDVAKVGGAQPLKIDRSKITYAGPFRMFSNGSVVIEGPAADGIICAPRIYYDAKTGALQLTLSTQRELAYFKFGSVIALKKGSDSNFIGETGGVFGSPSILFDPTSDSEIRTFMTQEIIPLPDTFSSLDDIPCFETNDRDANDPVNNVLNISQVGPHYIEAGGGSASYYNVHNLLLGKGDPCKLVGINLSEIKMELIAGKSDLDNAVAPDNGIWRMPTVEENRVLTGTASVDDVWKSTGFCYLGGMCFPSTGGNPSSYVGLWSNGYDVQADKACCLYVQRAYPPTPPTINPEYLRNYNEILPIRCVQRAPNDDISHM